MRLSCSVLAISGLAYAFPQLKVIDPSSLGAFELGQKVRAELNEVMRKAHPGANTPATTAKPQVNLILYDDNGKSFSFWVTLGGDFDDASPAKKSCKFGNIYQ